MYSVLFLSDRVNATILASLRHYLWHHQSAASAETDQTIAEIASNNGAFAPLNEQEIERVCDALLRAPSCTPTGSYANHSGPSSLDSGDALDCLIDGVAAVSRLLEVPGDDDAVANARSWRDGAAGLLDVTEYQNSEDDEEDCDECGSQGPEPGPHHEEHCSAYMDEEPV